jgi:hypothetical protein
MKKIGHVLALGVIALVVFAGTTSYAQVLQDTLSFHVPFSFYIENTRLPAGDYTIRAMDPTDTFDLLIANATDTVEVDFLTNAAHIEQPTTDPELEFQKFGNRYFLSHIWLQGFNRGFALMKPRMQQKLEKQGMHGEIHRIKARHVHR